MGRPLKRSKKARESDSESDFDEDMLSNGLTAEEEEMEEDGFESEDEDMSDDNDDDDDENDDGSEDDDDDGGKRNALHDEAEMDELENEYMSLRDQQQGILSNLKRHKDEDVLKGQAVKNQKALWDKTLEFRFLLQKAFSSSNRLPQDPMKSLFCESDESVDSAYSELIASSTKTLDSLLELEEALLEKNPSILQPTDDKRHGKQAKHSQSSESSDTTDDKEWSRISEMHGRIAAFRDKSIDKWQRKSQVATGAAAIKGKLHAFNQNISEQVSTYMRDPSRMIKQMQLRRSTVAVFGAVTDEETIPQAEEAKPDSVAQADGDPELLDDSDFYQQLLKEFFENIDPTSNEAAMYALKRYQTKKRKLVDRRASKGRKIRYHVHEKIVNFMTRQPPPKNNMPSALGSFNNLFLSKTLNTATAE